MPQTVLSFPDEQRVVTRLIENVPLFRRFSQQDVLGFMGRATRQEFLATEPLIAEGSLGQHMYILLDGQVEISKRGLRGDQQRLAILGPGECFGEMALIEEDLRSANVDALSAGRLLKVNIQTLEANPQFAARFYRNLARVLSERLRQTDERLSIVLSSTGQGTQSYRTH